MSSYLDNIEIDKCSIAKIIISPTSLDDDELCSYIMGAVANDSDFSFFEAYRGEMLFHSRFAPAGWSVAVKWDAQGNSRSTPRVEIYLTPVSGTSLTPPALSGADCAAFVEGVLSDLIDNLINYGGITPKDIIRWRFGLL